MATEFQTFAAGVGANALTPAAWAALTSLRNNGFVAGIASSQQINTALRQATTAAAGVAKFISDQGFDALDNGNINDFATAFSNALRKAALPSGIILMSGAGTAPAGAVKLNGAVVSITTTTQSLVNAVYCGDANNATAQFFYKCTNPASPSATRSTAGTYFVLEDTRGRFPRSWVDGGAIDAGRSLWEMQADDNKNHTHDQLGLASTTGSGTGGAGVFMGSSSVGILTGSSGTESRPVNFPCLFSITL